MTPTITFRPLIAAVAADGASRLDLLLSIQPPPLPPDRLNRQRPPLNLALVIDRSGSMQGEKLSHALKAARVLTGELTAQDRLAIVSFDDEATVVMPSRRVDDPLPFLQAIDTISCGSTTALFDGWLAGALQVAEHLNPQGLNRVLLLSDGQANEGITGASAIAERVAGLNQRGISTSAFGLGDGFDEDLMGAIASAGDGTLAQIESPAQLVDLYASELQGLASTCGRRVSIGIRPQHGAELVDVLNDLTPTSAGNLQLPNLRQGQTLQVGLRLQAACTAAWRSPCPSLSPKPVLTRTPVPPSAQSTNDWVRALPAAISPEVVQPISAQSGSRSLRLAASCSRLYRGAAKTISSRGV